MLNLQAMYSHLILLKYYRGLQVGCHFKVQNRNPNQQCSKLALFADEICGRITMLVCYIVDFAYQLHFYFANDNQLAILCSWNSEIEE